MEQSTILESLLDRDVLEVGDDSEGVRLSDQFRRTLAASQDEVQLEGINGTDTDIETALGDVPELLGAYRALREHAVDDFETPDIVRSMTIIAHLEVPVAHSDGAPDPFLPVPGDQLDGLLNLYEKAVVYFWREDCPPCDVVREDLEAIFASRSNDLTLFSVYGPAWPVHLQLEYGVVGAPVLLFVLDGTVDARLIGAHEVETIRSEVATLRELAASGADSGDNLSVS